MRGNISLKIEGKKYRIGIDLGGTFIKGGIVDSEGNLLVYNKTPTEVEKGENCITDNIATLCKTLIKQADLPLNAVVGVGMGVPGMIDSQKGVVIFSGNLHFTNYPIATALEARINLPVKIGNDANVATLGEMKFGSGKAYKNAVLLTLGTGVGGGVVINGKLLEGNRSAGAELGHLVIVSNGEKCTCGRKGCLEAYASASALIRDTKRAMNRDKTSKMWEIGSIENVTGKTAFDYMTKDASAKAVVENYIKKLGEGITDFANVFRPEAILLGGGVCAEGDKLVKPLQAFLDKHIFAGEKGPRVKILQATLGNLAGILGAGALVS